MRDRLNLGAVKKYVPTDAGNLHETEIAPFADVPDSPDIGNSETLDGAGARPRMPAHVSRGTIQCGERYAPCESVIEGKIV
jgi:hypothetical protein